MKAMVITGFGGTEVFQEKELPKPEPGVNELLVKIYASAINPVDYKVRKNGTWAGLNLPAIIGWDAAGIVERVGSGVKSFKPGDEVFYSPLIHGGHGTYSEYSVVNENIAALKPKNISFIEAASLPLAGCTALDAIIYFSKVKPGETVLVHAGASGTGSIGIQLAKISGAEVITTCSEKNSDFVHSLGADKVINYKKEDFAKGVLRETGGKLVDVVFDTVGNDTVSRSIEIIKPHGRIASIVNIAGDINSAYRKNISLFLLFMERANYKMELLRNLVEQGKLRPVIDSIFKLNQVAEAHKKLEQGSVRGKIVLNISKS
jgi:NADPH:quinone reductase-like Zn-dependent oxidoreductase